MAIRREGARRAAGTRQGVARRVPEAQDLAAFQHRDRFAPAVRCTACYERVRAFAYDGVVGEFTSFPFSIGLTRRWACVPMELWIGDRERPIRRLVPVGRRAC